MSNRKKKEILDSKSRHRIADGVAAVIQSLINPADPERYRGCRLLFEKIFGGPHKSISEQGLLSDYYYYQEGPFIASIDSATFANKVALWAVEKYRG